MTVCHGGCRVVPWPLPTDESIPFLLSHDNPQCLNMGKYLPGNTGLGATDLPSVEP